MEWRRRRDVGVVIVVMLALLFRLLHMRAALEINFPGNQLAIDLSIVAGDLQGALCAGGVVDQQHSIEKRVVGN